MSVPASYDLTLYRGDSARWQARLWTDGARTVPYNLSGAVVTAQIRDRPGGTVTVFLSCAVTLPNTIDIALAAGAPLPGRGVWDLQLQQGADVTTVLAGRVTVLAEVTA